MENILSEKNIDLKGCILQNVLDLNYLKSGMTYQYYVEDTHLSSSTLTHRTVNKCKC
jgi:hypothetical protein